MKPLITENHTQQADAKHLFSSPNGESLPRWREAFPSMQMIRADVRVPHTGAELVWVRIGADVDVAGHLAHVRQSVGDGRFIVLSDQPADEQALNAFSAGAKAYCNTHADVEILRQVANVVLQGGLWIGESLLQRIITASAHALPPVDEKSSASGMSSLSKREQEVALLIAQGQSNKDIARNLDITLRTVKAHVSAILEKLQVRDRLQIALKINRP
ncbi:MAG: response regulator transcription factor [Gammaproteobacteria bacterium]|nr:response regulator transcription factor [Gammaproteobacteria bacterium]MBU1730850.1 response regulator transcription factor [Gammaproteobacteria bacterium]MBU1891396.1 response regulator transcription factor [Gammaproteobacteria bacterium]